MQNNNSNNDFFNDSIDAMSYSLHAFLYGVDTASGSDVTTYRTVNFQSGKTTIWPERYSKEDLSNILEENKKKLYLQEINNLAINTDYEHVQS